MGFSLFRVGYSILASLVLGCSLVHAQLIGVQLYSTQNPDASFGLTSSQTAGLLSQDNFNVINGTNFQGANFGTVALKDSNGNGTGVSLTVSGLSDSYSTNTLANDGSAIGGGTPTANQILLSGQTGVYSVGTGTAPTAVFTLTGLTAGASYDLVIYTLTNASGVPGTINLTEGATAGPASYDYLLQNGNAFDGSFIRGSATSQGTATTANYVEFDEVTPQLVSSLGTIQFQLPDTTLGHNAGAAIAGFQIEEVPEPATWAMLVLAAMPFAGWLVRLRRA